jgi:DNA-binding CsgD family transcriptional regulator
VGHCYPEGSAGVPYQPFVEAFEAFARQRSAQALRAELGSWASEVARMVPALRSRLQLELTAPENPEDDRLRLLSGILDCLRTIGAAQPLLLVLEDLHDADRGTLDLLVYVARHLAGTPLLVVGTYRDVEVDRAHPLAVALAELRRVSQFQRVQLSELSVDEVQHLLASSSQEAVPRPLAELVHHRSGGNALFVHELLAFLMGEGLVERRGGVLRRVGDEASLAGQMPEGLRDAVGKRLSRLSPAANQVLRVASVIGREFSLGVLRRVHARPEELESALEEAVGEAIVDEHLVVGAMITYRFRHAFFQQTLSDEIMAPRRIRLHQQVAHALEDVHARRLEEHAAELAEHYSFSSDTSDLSKAVDYAMLAAKRATEVFAYGEAARQLERALAVQDLVDPDNRAKRLDLLLALGVALLPSGETDRVTNGVAPDAFALADGLDDRARAFRACRLALDCLFAQGASAGLAGGSSNGQPAYLIWAERASRYADPDSIEHAYTNLSFAHALYIGGQYAQARTLRLQALALARQHADAEVLFRCAIFLLAQGAPQRWEERVRLAEECAAWPRLGVSGQTLGQALWYSALVQLAQGERAQAEDLFRQVAELAERTRVATLGLYAAGSEVSLAVVDGHLDDALELIKRYIERADEAGASIRGRGDAVRLLLSPALYLGRADLWLTAFDEAAASLARPGLAFAFFTGTAMRAICLAQLGRVEEARTLVGPLLDDIEGIDEERRIVELIMLLQAAVAVEHQAAAQALAAHLTCVSHLTGEVPMRTCFARHLGDAAALVGDRAAARANYLQALDVAAKIRFRPELALTHLRLAELLYEDETERSGAQEHLNLAVPELRDMHMQPALERGLKLLQKLEQQALAPATDTEAAHVLTGREREVARLVAAGRSNREIADTLVITEGTVEVHVKHILSKLGYRSRSQVAAWAANESLRRG